MLLFFPIRAAATLHPNKMPRRECRFTLDAVLAQWESGKKQQLAVEAGSKALAQNKNDVVSLWACLLWLFQISQIF